LEVQYVPINISFALLATIVVPSIEDATDVHASEIAAGAGDHWY
jgi:hypothetical protein